MQVQPTRLDDWLQLIRSEFDDTDDLRLTVADAGDRWPLDPAWLASVLFALERSGYLRRTGDGVYFRRPDARRDVAC